jgi:hypothetical protein
MPYIRKVGKDQKEPQYPAHGKQDGGGWAGGGWEHHIAIADQVCHKHAQHRYVGWKILQMLVKKFHAQNILI